MAENAPSIYGTGSVDGLERQGPPSWRRAALGVAFLYLALLIAMAVGVERSLRSLEDQLGADTVRLLAREQANLVIERSLETLRYPSADASRRLHERIQDLTVLSEVVTSLSVVDSMGRVVASEKPGPYELQTPSAALFANPPQPRLERRVRAFFGGGDYVVLVPLLEEGRLEGHLRVGLHSRPSAALHEQVRWRRMVLGALGLAAVGAFGPLLLWRLSAGRDPALKSTAASRTPATTDEFARVLHGATKGDLDDARRQGERGGLAVGALARVLEPGVVVVGRDLRLEHASARARELCGSADETEFREAWRVIESKLRQPASARPSEPGATRPLLVEPRPGHAVRVELHRLEGPGEECLVTLSDPRAAEAVENDARLRRQLDGLRRVYRTLAHELRAPLGAVMLNLDLLQDSLVSGLWNERGRRYIGVLRDELQRLHRSLHGIFTQTVPDAAPQEFDLARSLRDLAALLSPQARRQAVQLEVRLSDPCLPVRGYPDRLHQAFLNVAVNALEAMPDGGQLTLDARRDGAQARVVLRDTGPGIPTAALPHVYDPDFTTKNGGSGIGLHVARVVVEQHGGEIGIESRPGKGTAVCVAVPLAGSA